MGVDNQEKNLIIENTYADGALKTIFNPVAANMKKFGEILKDSAKLIGGDVAFLVKLTFGRLKSLDELRDMNKKEEARRKGLISKISKNSKELMNSWPDGKITSMMIAPGLFFTTEALSGVQYIGSEEFRAELGSYGLDALPLVGPLLSGEKSERSQFFRDISRCEPGDGECMDNALRRLTDSGKGEKQGKLSKIATTINSIFLFSNHVIDGEVLLEEDEKEDPEVSEDILKDLDMKARTMIDDYLKDERAAWLDERKKYFAKLTEEASTVISLNSELAATDDSKLFFQTLEKMKKLGGDQTKDMDIDKIKSGFQEMGQKFKDDEKSMKALEEEFEKEKLEKTDELVNKKLEEIILSSFKSQFLQTMKGELEDYYESVTTELSGGMSAEQQKLVSKDPIGKEYIANMKEAENKLKQSLSKLKQS